MASELQWVPHFCLTCDKQTDGETYCSESCRLADYEETSSFFASGPSSPTWEEPSSPPTYLWPTDSTGHSRKLFRLSPAYDFGNAQPYGSTPLSYHHFRPQRHSANGSNGNNGTSSSRRAATPATAPNPTLFPSASASMLLPPMSTTTTSVTYHHVLSPSSSQSSLNSMWSNVSSMGGALGALSAFATGSTGNLSQQHTFGSSAGSGVLSDKTRSELRKYASSLQQSKLQRHLHRRRSC